MAGKLTEAVLAALDAQTVMLPAEATIGRVIAERAVELGRVHERRATLAREIEEVFLAHPFGELLVTSSRIGPAPPPGSWAKSATVPGSNGSKLASYAGLAPSRASRARRSRANRRADAETTA